MKSQRVELAQAKWFVLHRGTGVYLEYGFPSKSAAMNEVGFLNGKEKAEGRKPEFAVSPVGPRPPPPKLTFIKGGG